MIDVVVVIAGTRNTPASDVAKRLESHEPDSDILVVTRGCTGADLHADIWVEKNRPKWSIVHVTPWWFAEGFPKAMRTKADRLIHFVRFFEALEVLDAPRVVVEAFPPGSNDNTVDVELYEHTLKVARHHGIEVSCS